MHWYEDSKVIAAFISATVTILIALWTYFTSKKSQKEIEFVKNELAEKNLRKMHVENMNLKPEKDFIRNMSLFFSN